MFNFGSSCPSTVDNKWCLGWAGVSKTSRKKWSSNVWWNFKVYISRNFHIEIFEKLYFLAEKENTIMYTCSFAQYCISNHFELKITEDLADTGCKGSCNLFWSPQVLQACRRLIWITESFKIQFPHIQLSHHTHPCLSQTCLFYWN